MCVGIQMGKYDFLKGKVPVLPPELLGEDGSKRQAKVDGAKGEFTERDPEVLIRLYADVRRRKEDLEDQVSAQGLRLEALVQILTELFEAKGIHSLDIDKVGNWRLDIEPYAIVKDKEVYRKWCLSHKFGPQMGLSWQTTNSTVKDMLMGGKKTPPGVDVYLKPKPVFTKAK